MAFVYKPTFNYRAGRDCDEHEMFDRTIFDVATMRNCFHFGDNTSEGRIYAEAVSKDARVLVYMLRQHLAKMGQLLRGEDDEFSGKITIFCPPRHAAVYCSDEDKAAQIEKAEKYRDKTFKIIEDCMPDLVLSKNAHAKRIEISERKIAWEQYQKGHKYIVES